MSQKLMLPVNQCQILSGYQNAAYRAYWGYPHYGVDYYDPSRILRALGKGEVYKTGNDSTKGYFVVVGYHDVWVHGEGKKRDLIARCYHLAEPAWVTEGQWVQAQEPLGKLGATGQCAVQVHVHLELDTNIDCPLGGLWLQMGNTDFQPDTTLNPAKVLYIHSASPYYQTLVNRGYADWVADSDMDIPLW